MLKEIYVVKIHLFTPGCTWVKLLWFSSGSGSAHRVEPNRSPVRSSGWPIFFRTGPDWVQTPNQSTKINPVISMMSSHIYLLYNNIRPWVVIITVSLAFWPPKMAAQCQVLERHPKRCRAIHWLPPKNSCGDAWASSGTCSMTRSSCKIIYLVCNICGICHI